MVPGLPGCGGSAPLAEYTFAGAAAAFATRAPARFDSRAKAVARHLWLSGLVDPDAPAATSGVVEEDGRWHPALDPRMFGVGEPASGR